MSQDLAVENNPDCSFIALLDDIVPLIEMVRPHESGDNPDDVLASLQVLRDNLDKDYARVADVSELLFGDDVTAYGDRCTSVFVRWEDDEGGAPSLTAMMAHAWEHFGLPADDPAAKGALMATILGEVKNELKYHGNEHYRKVLFHVIRMIVTHNNIHGDDEWKLGNDEIALLLISGAIHDLGHEGGDNMRDGIYTPGYMEQKAFDMAKPYFEELDMDRDHTGILETLVFCTDITFFAGDDSPCVRMRSIYDYYFSDEKDDKILNYIIGKLRRFDENPRLSLIAMILHEADIATSAGLSYDQSIRETINIMEERDVKTAGPNALLVFLKEQLGGSMKTDAGQAIFGSAMDVIMDQATQDCNNGRETFYD